MTMWAKVKWIALAIFSAVVTLLALIYGKRTPQVIRTKLREVRAREEVLGLELKAVELRAKADAGKGDVRKHLDKAAELDRKILRLRENRTRYINSSRDLPYLSDDDLASADNARARAGRTG